MFLNEFHRVTRRWLVVTFFDYKMFGPVRTALKKLKGRKPMYGAQPTFRIADRIRFDGHVEVGVRMAEVILNRLRYSRAEMDQVIALIDNHMKFKDVHRMKESTLKDFWL